MQGASEFTLGGELEHWSITERNAALRIPALVLMGEFDTMSTECHQTVWVLAWALNSNPQLPFVALTFDSTGFACHDRKYSKRLFGNSCELAKVVAAAAAVAVLDVLC